jgi:predicted ArsR family transcriptional regulator
LAADLPEPVVRLIADHIDSVELIDVLLLLKRSPDRAWNAEEISQRLYTSPSSAANRLEALHASGLASVQETDGPPLYRYAPSGPDLGLAVEGLEEAYGKLRTRVINLIFSKPTQKIRTFADAFRIRGDKT